MWGWTVPPETAFRLLDEWYAAGLRKVDAATNYPLNGNPTDWRRSENILADWLRTHGVQDLEVVVKVGSLSNQRLPDHNLSPSFLRLSAEEYAGLLGESLACLMIHWDNRTDRAAIAASLETLRELSATGPRAGLSGIKYPELYREVLQEYPDWRLPLECKHNVFQSGLDHYAPLAPWVEPWVYGVNAGGVKLAASYRKDATLQARGGTTADTELHERLRSWLEAGGADPLQPRSMNEIGLLYARCDPRVAGILLGPSRPEQLRDSLEYLNRLDGADQPEVYDSLTQVLTDAPG